MVQALTSMDVFLCPYSRGHHCRTCSRAHASRRCSYRRGSRTTAPGLGPASASSRGGAHKTLYGGRCIFLSHAHGRHKLNFQNPLYNIASQEEKGEKVEGDQALNKLFQQIYGDGTLLILSSGFESRSFRSALRDTLKCPSSTCPLSYQRTKTRVVR